MSPTTILRVAAVISLFFAAGHTLGGRKDWSPMGDNDVLKAMRTTRFDTQGVNRSYLDFYRGFGYSLTVFLLLQTAALWQLATMARTDASGVRPLIAFFALASLSSGVVSWIYLFPVPAVFSAVLTACLAAAFVTAG